MPRTTSFGSLVSSFVHGLPPNPVEPQGQLVSDFVHDHHYPTDPIHPQGELVSHFVHGLDELPPNPVEPQGQLVSGFVHILHEPDATFGGDFVL